MLLGQVRRATKVSSGLRKASAFLVCLAPLFDMLCSLQCNCSSMSKHEGGDRKGRRRKGPSNGSPFGLTVPVPSWVRKAPLELVSLVWFGVKLFPNITVNGACCFAPDSFAVLYCTMELYYRSPASKHVDYSTAAALWLKQQSFSFFFFLFLHPGVQANTNAKGSRVVYAMPIPLDCMLHWYY